MPKLKPDQEATVIDLRQETDALASWPTGERLRALHRIIPRAQVEAVLAQTGHDRALCPRLPGWFMVWFLIALAWIFVSSNFPLLSPKRVYKTQ